MKLEETEGVRVEFKETAGLYKRPASELVYTEQFTLVLLIAAFVYR